MTPKEKALSLLDKMEKQTYSYQEYAGANPSIAEIGYEAGKKCALITVDEILSELATIHCYGENDIEDSTQWYKEVKQELEKL
jgi:hypothetical protein